MKITKSTLRKAQRDSDPHEDYSDLGEIESPPNLKGPLMFILGFVVASAIGWIWLMFTLFGK